jgi:peptidylprolyl isomerase
MRLNRGFNIAAILSIVAMGILPLAGQEASAGATVRTRSGLRWVDLQVGEGETPDPGSTCQVFYRGWFYEDGKRGELFDTSRGVPFSFVLGAGNVIPGWEEGVATMRPKGTRVLVVPPHLAYGQRGSTGGVIPPNATLMFEIRLLQVKPTEGLIESR